MEKMYTYAVARIKARETALLTHQDMEQLIASKSFEDCLRILSDKGYESGKSYDEIILKEQQKTWDFIFELTGDLSVFDVFRLENDFHNLKAAIKGNFSGYKPERIYVSGGTVPSELFEKAVKEGDYSILPEIFREAAKSGVSVLNKTGDGQRCDMLLDKAEFEAKLEAAEKSGSEFLIKLARLNTDIFALKAALRCCVLKKDKEFTESAIPKNSSFDVKSLAKASEAGMDELLELVRATDYSASLDALGISVAEFEKWCDNKVMDFIKEQKYDCLTIAPVAAYILARHSELKMVRIILSSKLNGFSGEMVRERLRDMYV